MTLRKECLATKAIRYRAEGLCGCGRERLSGKQHCHPCITAHLERLKAQRKAWREAGVCWECGAPRGAFMRCERCRHRSKGPNRGKGVRP